MSIDTVIQNKATVVKEYFSSYLKNIQIPSSLSGAKDLEDSICYSALNPGKCFRPVLTILTAEALGGEAKDVLAFATSVEMAHTYSLIHDDLPALDNDSQRRGKPSNHTVFGEDIALLAGDALLTEAFYILSKEYSHIPDKARLLIENLAFAIGLRGMVRGQAMDLKIQKDLSQTLTMEEVKELHNRKTGDLIKVSIMGAAHLIQSSEQEQKNLATYGENLGLAFQIKDDLLDYDPKSPESTGFPAILGKEEAAMYLVTTTEKAIKSLDTWGSSAKHLREIALYNQKRTH